MNRLQSQLNPVTFRRAAMLALLLFLAVPTWAATQRAIKSRKAPIYPELAKRLKIAGPVTLEATVDPQGKVTAIKVVSGTQILAQAAEDAVWSWVFVPAAAESTVDLDFNFGAGGQ